MCLRLNRVDLSPFNSCGVGFFSLPHRPSSSFPFPNHPSLFFCPLSPQSPFSFPHHSSSTSNHLINNRSVTIQEKLTQLVLKQVITIHNTKGQTWSLILISLIIFITVTNLLGLLPHSFTPTTQLSINLAIAIPLWAGTVVIGLPVHSPLTHWLTQSNFLPWGKRSCEPLSFSCTSKITIAS